MAQKRMFSLKIVDTDAFLDMPQSTQNLYFHFGMRADDEGFIGNVKRIMKMIGSSEDDMKVLLAKRFILLFESGVVVIKHWKMNNYLQNDRIKETTYLQEKSLLYLKDNGSYTLDESQGSPVYTKCIHSIDKISIEKSNIYSSSPNYNASETLETLPNENDNSVLLANNEKKQSSVKEVIDNNKLLFDYWNTKNIVVHKTLSEELNNSISKFLKKYKLAEFKIMVDRYKRVLDDKKYFFSYIWSLKDFLNRKNGAVDFADDGSKWQDYCLKVGVESKQEFTETQEGVFKI